MKADSRIYQARILAHLSGDSELTRLCKEGEGFHTRTAQMLGLVSREEARCTNLRVIYGQGPRALAREINDSWREHGQPKRVDQEQTQEYIDAFFDTYKGILRYFQDE